MLEKYKELLEACRDGNMYDFIANEGWRFDKSELIDILKQTYYAIYQRLRNQSKEVERLIPSNLLEYDFFEEELTVAETAYIEYLAGDGSYDYYLYICKKEGIEPEPR